MKDAELLEQLEEIVRQLGIELVWDDGEFRGGICRVEGKQLFLMNRVSPAAQKVEILCRELSSLDLSQLFILPRVRQRIEQAGRPSSPAASRRMRDRGLPRRGVGSRFLPSFRNVDLDRFDKDFGFVDILCGGPDS